MGTTLAILQLRGKIPFSKMKSRNNLRYEAIMFLDTFRKKAEIPSCPTALLSSNVKMMLVVSLVEGNVRKKELVLEVCKNCKGFKPD